MGPQMCKVLHRKPPTPTAIQKLLTPAVPKGKKLRGSEPTLFTPSEMEAAGTFIFFPRTLRLSERPGVRAGKTWKTFSKLHENSPTVREANSKSDNSWKFGEALK